MQIATTSTQQQIHRGARRIKLKTNYNKKGVHDKQDWEPHYDVTTTMSAKKQEDISFRTERKRNVKPETQRLRLDFNPGTYGFLTDINKIDLVKS